MAILHDEEFGPITLRRSARANSVRIRVDPAGKLRASLPLYAPVFLVRRLIKGSRPQLRSMLAEYQGVSDFHHGMQIGKSHTLIVHPASASSTTVEKYGTQITVYLAENDELNSPSVVNLIRARVIEALRLEAKSYLPRRLKVLAEKHHFVYQTVRFSHASGRWGSCSSNGTISLNIALMKLPFELIDYVLIHELSHTQQMNHSQDFWRLVAQADPTHKSHRAALKSQSPSI